MFDMRKESGSHKFYKAHLLYRLSNEYEEIFICFVKFWSRPLVSLDSSRAQNFIMRLLIPAETMAYALF